MRLHVVSLAHTNTTQAFPSCAFTQKVVRFCQMMHPNHSIFLYAGEQNEAPVTELVPCISERKRSEMVGYNHYTAADWSHPHWQGFNTNVIGQMHERIEPHDVICLIGGRAHQPIVEAFPGHLSVEFGIGYEGVIRAPNTHWVFESYAWMHTVYGAQFGAAAADGRAFDYVIPNQIDPALFPAGKGDGGYFLYVGRLIDRKGYSTAQEVCQRLGKRLILAGPGEQHGYGEFVGEVDPVERARLMGGATALFAPTRYVEPFGTVHVEAMACGTPVIASDWGVFTETIDNGVNGYRCRVLADYLAAAEAAPGLDRTTIRERALARYSMDVVSGYYERYFARLATLWDKGWYQ